MSFFDCWSNMTDGSMEKKFIQQTHIAYQPNKPGLQFHDLGYAI